MLPSKVLIIFVDDWISIEKVSLYLLDFILFSGHPAAHAEYFSLNKTTAELLVLQPINRDLYQRFTLIIKVIKNSYYFSFLA